MIYRFNGSSRIICDFEGLYKGSCILLGGSPCALEEQTALLKNENIVVVGMNNVPAAFPGVVDIGITADKPICYSPKILLDRKITHFVSIGKVLEVIPDTNIQWKDVPNTYFYTAHQKVKIKEFLDVVRDNFAWWKNVFPIAIQLCYYLGFRTIYCLGCKLTIPTDKNGEGKAYSFDKSMNKDQITWNNRTYGHCVMWMRDLKPHFEEHGLKIISCTKDSLLNSLYDYVPLEKAVETINEKYPKEYDFSKVKHSSDLSAPVKDEPTK